MLTIIIPTMNRSDFLIRLLDYYGVTGCKHRISIGDSSDDEHSQIIQAAIKRLNDKLDIEYCRYASDGEPATTWRLLQGVETPYIAFLPDDDFIIISGLDKCVKFLQDNYDYSVVLGKAILFSLDKSGPYGRIAGVSEYGLRSIENNSAAERLIYHLSNYTNPNFGVHRTQEFYSAYRRVTELSDKSFTEIMSNCVSCIQGKIKQLDCLYLARQGHDRRYLLPDAYDWITKKDWFSSYEIFRNVLMVELEKQDKLSPAEAAETVKQAFWGYLNCAVTKKFQQKYHILPNGRIKLDRILRNLPATAAVAKKIKNIVCPRDMSLAALSSQCSCWREDFLPILKSVSQGVTCV